MENIKQNNRKLKIEEAGDTWKGTLKPKIRLMGHWLDRAGFNPGQYVHVVFKAPGILELHTAPPK